MQQLASLPETLRLLSCVCLCLHSAELKRDMRARWGGWKGWEGVRVICLLTWFIVQTHALQSPASQSHSSPDLFLERLCESGWLQGWRHWCYVSGENPLFVYDIGLSIMWKLEFLTEESHIHVTGTPQCVLFNQNGFECLNSEKSTSHIC